MCGGGGGGRAQRAVWFGVCARYVLCVRVMCACYVCVLCARVCYVRACVMRACVMCVRVACVSVMCVRVSYVCACGMRECYVCVEPPLSFLKHVVRHLSRYANTLFVIYLVSQTRYSSFISFRKHSVTHC